MAEEDFLKLLLETQKKNEESMRRITAYTQDINKRIKKILGAL